VRQLSSSWGHAMSTTAAGIQSSSLLRPKYVLFGLIGLMFVYVLGHNESFLVNPRDPVWQHYQPFKWWLLAHGLAGACALLLVPMQFSDRVRQRYLKLHRVVGRIYVAGAFIAGPLGIYIKFFQERLGSQRSFTMAAATHGILWMVTTGIAFAFILKGKVQQHRQWMTRSFVVGPLVFIGARAILGLTGLEKMGSAAIETTLWVCLAFSIPLADVVLQWQELLRLHPATSKVTVAAR
jgi:uncharacterized membrane protein